MVVVVILTVCGGCLVFSQVATNEANDTEVTVDGRYIYIHNDDGSLRNRYFIDLSRVTLYGFSKEHGIWWCNKTRQCYYVYAENIEVHPQPVELYEEQYQELTGSDG